MEYVYRNAGPPEIFACFESILEQSAQVGLAAEKFGDKAALICGQDSLSFKDLHSRSDRYAEWLLEEIGFVLRFGGFRVFFVISSFRFQVSRFRV